MWWLSGLTATQAVATTASSGLASSALGSTALGLAGSMMTSGGGGAGAAMGAAAPPSYAQAPMDQSGGAAFGVPQAPPAVPSPVVAPLPATQVPAQAALPVQAGMGLARPGLTDAEVRKIATEIPERTEPPEKAPAEPLPGAGIRRIPGPSVISQPERREQAGEGPLVINAPSTEPAAAQRPNFGRRLGETALDVYQASQGQPLYSAVNRPAGSEAGMAEKILSPVADVVGALGYGRLPSRQARLERERIDIERNRAQVNLLSSGWDMMREMTADARRLPRERQSDTLRAYANLLGQNLPQPFGAAAQAILEHEARTPGLMSTRMENILRRLPWLDALRRSDPNAYAQALSRQDTLSQMQGVYDSVTIPDVQERLISAMRWLQENKPEVLAEAQKDGIRNLADIDRYNRALPEGPNGLELPQEWIDVIARNPYRFSDWIDPEAVDEDYQKARAREAAKEAKPEKHWVLTTDEYGRQFKTDPVSGDRIQVSGAPPVRARVQSMMRVTEPDGSTETVFQMSDGTFKRGSGEPYVPSSGAKYEKIGSKSAKLSNRAREQLGSATMVLSDLVQLRGMMKPGVLGWRGLAGAKAGGIAESIGGEELGSAVALFASGEVLAGGGATMEEITQYKQRAEAVSIMMRGYFTGELSKRISNEERKFAREQAKLTNFTGSLSQAEAATKNLMRLYLKSEMASALDAGAPIFDMNNWEDVDRLDTMIRDDLGLSVEESLSWIQEYRNMQNIGAAIAPPGG